MSLHVYNVSYSAVAKRYNLAIYYYKVFWGVKYLKSVYIFTDSPVSLTYRSNDSTISSSIRQPVNLTIEVKAYPRTVSFSWYFIKQSKWIAINSSDERFLINNHELESVLTLRSFSTDLAGTYKVEATNGIGDAKEFLYTLHAGRNLICKMLY